jgi:hypothetical protein
MIPKSGNNRIFHSRVRKYKFRSLDFLLKRLNVLLLAFRDNLARFELLDRLELDLINLGLNILLAFLAQRLRFAHSLIQLPHLLIVLD